MLSLSLTHELLSCLRFSDFIYLLLICLGFSFLIWFFFFLYIHVQVCRPVNVHWDVSSHAQDALSSSSVYLGSCAEWILLIAWRLPCLAWSQRVYLFIESYLSGSIHLMKFSVSLGLEISYLMTERNELYQSTSWAVFYFFQWQTVRSLKFIHMIIAQYFHSGPCWLLRWHLNSSAVVFFPEAVRIGFLWYNSVL